MKAIKHPTAKMTDQEVLEMRERVRLGMSDVKTEADRFGVARETIRKALRGETFRNVGNLEMEPVRFQAGVAPVVSEEEIQASVERAKKMFAEMQAAGTKDALDAVLLRGPDKISKEEDPSNPLEEK